MGSPKKHFAVDPDYQMSEAVWERKKQKNERGSCFEVIIYILFLELVPTGIFAIIYNVVGMHVLACSSHYVPIYPMIHKSFQLALEWLISLFHQFYFVFSVSSR